MKKAFSITFIVLILMNSMGFYGIFLGLKFRHGLQVAEQLDRGDLSGFETVTIKIPISIPYASNSKDFERVDGQYEYHGDFYRLVKQRYVNDTLTVVCIKDKNTKQIAAAMKSYVKTFAQQHTGNNNSKFQNSLIKDYIAQSFELIQSATGWEKTISFTISAQIESNAHLIDVAQPPEVA